MEQVPSYVMLGISKPVEEPQASPTPQRPLSAMGEACSRMDLTAIHQILFTTHYRDDEGSNEVNKISAFWFPSSCSV
jgi:BR-signaling kinase